MSAFLNKVLQDDFVWTAIHNKIAGRYSASRTGFHNVACPMCRDYKRRCGISHGNEIIVNCYNCGFVTGWSVGKSLGKKFRSFLTALGMSENEVAQLNYKAFSYRHLLEQSPICGLLPATKYEAPVFDSAPLPPGSKSMHDLVDEGCDDPDFLAAQAYIAGRGAEVAAGFEYFWSPDTSHEMNRRVIIPLLHEERIVGYTARAIDGENRQRYQMISPSNYLFNSAALTKPNRKYVILVEGVLDAIAIDGVGLLGGSLNQTQIDWIKSSGKTVVMLVDRDRRGQKLVDVAIENDWHVSFAVGGINGWWDPAVKDAAQAVSLYGSLWTVMSIIEEASNNKIKINFQRKKIIGK